MAKKKSRKKRISKKERSIDKLKNSNASKKKKLIPSQKNVEKKHSGSFSEGLNDAIKKMSIKKDLVLESSKSQRKSNEKGEKRKTKSNKNLDNSVKIEKKINPINSFFLRSAVKAKILFAAAYERAVQLKKPFLTALQVFFSFFIIIISLITVVITFEVISNGRIMTGFEFAQENFGYKKSEDALQKINNKLSDYQNSVFTFQLREKSVELPLSELEISILIEDSINSIPIFSFKKNSIFSLLPGIFKKKSFEPYFYFEPDFVFSMLQNRFEMSEKRSKNAYFSRDENNIIQIIPEKNGEVISKDDLRISIIDNINSLSVIPIDLVIINEEATITAEVLKAQSDSLLRRIQNEISIKYNDRIWKLNLSDFLEHLNFEKENEDIKIILNDSIIEAFFERKIFAEIEKQTSNVKIYYDDNNNIVFEGAAEDGLAIDKNKLFSELNDAINTFQKEVIIKTYTKKAVIDADPQLVEMGIKELLGTGHTAFAGSTPNRVHNINVSMKKYNGYIIEKDQIFSFNDVLGEVNAQTGYKTELVIKSTGTVPEYGGGVCQVSSTAFKAALLSGLPIVERYPHSYAVSYYAQVDGYGLDATIYPGIKDLKFKNDTGFPILIQAFVEGNNAKFKFYGTGDGRSAYIHNYKKYNYRGSGATQYIPTKTLPSGVMKQVEKANSGFDAYWERVIIRPDGNEEKEDIYSRYRSTANRILVGE